MPIIVQIDINDLPVSSINVISKVANGIVKGDKCKNDQWFYPLVGEMDFTNAILYIKIYIKTRLDWSEYFYTRKINSIKYFYVQQIIIDQAAIFSRIPSLIYLLKT